MSCTRSLLENFSLVLGGNPRLKLVPYPINTDRACNKLLVASTYIRTNQKQRVSGEIVSTASLKINVSRSFSLSVYTNFNSMIVHIIWFRANAVTNINCVWLYLA